MRNVLSSNNRSQSTAAVRTQIQERASLPAVSLFSSTSLGHASNIRASTSLSNEGVPTRDDMSSGQHQASSRIEGSIYSSLDTFERTSPLHLVHHVHQHDDLRRAHIPTITIINFRPITLAYVPITKRCTHIQANVPFIPDTARQGSA